MYVDSELCFVVFDFLQILYVPFTLANYTLVYPLIIVAYFKLHLTLIPLAFSLILKNSAKGK